MLHVVVSVRSLTTASQEAKMVQDQWQIGCACVRVEVARSPRKPILVDTPRSNSSSVMIVRCRATFFALAWRNPHRATDRRDPRSVSTFGSGRGPRASPDVAAASRPVATLASTTLATTRVTELVGH